MTITEYITETQRGPKYTRCKEHPVPKPSTATVTISPEPITVTKTIIFTDTIATTVVLGGAMTGLPPAITQVPDYAVEYCTDMDKYSSACSCLVGGRETVMEATPTITVYGRLISYPEVSHLVFS